jgi:cell division protein FtsL
MGRLSFLMAVVLMTSAVSLVTSRYQARQLFIELDRGRSQTHQLDNEWRQLQLDRAELARNARVDRTARDVLKMVSISPDRTIYLNQAPVAGQAGGAQ